MKNKLIAFLVIIIIILSAISIFFYVKYDELSKSVIDWYYGNLNIVQNKLIQDDIWINKDGRWWINADYIVSDLDKRIYYSGSGNRVYIPAECLNFKLESDKLNEWMYERISNINMPVWRVDKKKYICVDDLAKVYAMEHRYFEDMDVHALYSADSDRSSIQVARADQMYKIYNKPTLKSVLMGKILSGDKFYKMFELDGFAFIITQKGSVGYIKESDKCKYSDFEISPTNLRELREKKLSNKPIRLSWQQVYSYKPFEGEMKYSPEEGIDIVAPTWFEMNVDGIVLNTADVEYVKTAHTKGFQVWPTFTNHFDPKWTHSMLSSRENRDRVISQMLVYCALYDLDGINIDFENMYIKDKQLFVDFVELLSNKLNEQGMVVSIDVTVPDGSDMWSKVYDREALIQYVDYMMLMAYDEHWGSSPVAGSVSSRDWVITGIEKTLRMVPPQKLVLGVPFYSRIWTQRSSGKVKSKAVGAKAQQKWLQKTGAEVIYDEKTGQNYAESKVDGKLQKIWFEDSRSLSMRLGLAKKYNLAGIAGWSQSFTTDETWKQITEEYSH